MFAVIAGIWLTSSQSIKIPGRFYFGYWRIDALYDRKALVNFSACQAACGRATRAIQKYKWSFKTGFESNECCNFQTCAGAGIQNEWT